MTGLHPSLIALRQAFVDHAVAHALDIQVFCGAALADDLPAIAMTAQRGPATALVDELEAETCAATQPVVDAVKWASGHVAWCQSYTADDPEFDENYLQNYGWFNLISPSGPFISKTMRLSVGYWGQGLHYPRHWHVPEEIYLVLAGRAIFVSEGRADVDGGPGATIAHYSNQPHAARMPDAPLLAAAFWRGNQLEAKSDLVGKSA